MLNSEVIQMDKLQLTADNYYSLEADRQYMSVSQIKGYIPIYGGCEARALAKREGWKEKKKSTAFLVGGYVDAYFEGTLEKYKQENPEIYTQKGTLRAEYNKANEMIEKVESDKRLIHSLQGQKQSIFTADLLGFTWKIKLDVYSPDNSRIIDLKTCADIFEDMYCVHRKKRVKWIEYYGYLLQSAIYREVEKQANNRATHFDFFITAVSKQDTPDARIISLSNPNIIIDQLELIQAPINEYHDSTGCISHLDRIKGLIEGLYTPTRCECCEYCRETSSTSLFIAFEDWGEKDV